MFANWLSLLLRYCLLRGLYLKPIKIDQQNKKIEEFIDFLEYSENETVYNTDIDNLSEQSELSNDNIQETQEVISNIINESINNTNIFSESSNIQSHYHSHSSKSLEESPIDIL